MSHIYIPLHLTFSGIILYNIIPRRKEVTMEWWQWVLWGLILIVAFAIAIAAMTMAPPLSYILFGVAILIFLVDGWWGVWVVLTNPSPPSPPIPTSSAGWDVQESAATPTPRGGASGSPPACTRRSIRTKHPSPTGGGNILHPEWGEEPVPCQPGGNSPYPPYCYCGGP